jgi:O-acetyl-ADP-ribose deacetylase (regulator of RNase III)
MFWEADNDRDERKQRFIKMIRENRSRELIDRLSEKLLAYDHEEIDAAEVFRTAGAIAKKGTTLISDFKKRPDVILAGIAMDEDRYVTGIGDVGISVRKSAPSEVFADAVISPCGPDGSMTARAAARIKEAGGVEIEKELMSSAPIDPGSAVSTGPGKIPASNIIHINTAGIPAGSGLLRPALLSAFELAEKLEAQTVACPGFSTGAGEISPAEAAAAIIGGIKEHHAENITKIIIAEEDEDTIDAIVLLLEKCDEEE